MDPSVFPPPDARPLMAPRPKRSKPHVLLVTPFLPEPPLDGGKKRVHTLLRLLSGRYDFTVLSFIQNPEEVWRAPLLKKHCRAVIPVPRQVDPLPDPEGYFLPEIARSCYSLRMAEALRRVLREDPPALVHFEFLQMAQYRRWVTGCPAVFTEHDISNISFFRSYFREMTGWRRWGRIAEWMRLVKYQMDACGGFDGVITLTPEDTEKLRSFLPDLFVRCITTGVDLAHFTRRRENGGRARAAEVNLVYVGHYLHYPNEDAILYFCRDIFPRIEQMCPIARLWVVGSGPTPAVERLKQNPRIRVTGAVKDVKPFLDQADVFVAPLRLGEGIKGKVLEAMACGVPVVATPVAARGLAARADEHFLVGTSPADFAEKTVRLVFDRALRSRLVGNARALVEERYDWRRLADQVDGFYREILKKG